MHRPLPAFVLVVACGATGEPRPSPPHSTSSAVRPKVPNVATSPAPPAPWKPTAKEIEGCALAPACRQMGRCTPTRDGDCVARGDDCTSTIPCRVRGQCVAVDGFCYVAAKSAKKCAEHAAPFTPCALRGECAVQGGVCRATEAQHCDESGIEGSPDRELVDGRCVVTEKSCAAWCPEGKKCALVKDPDFPFSQCEQVPTSDEDCANACRSDARCKAGPTGCIATAKSCAASSSCSLYGYCEAEGGRCVAASDSACEAGENCKREGQCRAFGGQCVARSDADCANSELCKERGQCTALHGECVAVSDEQCAKAPACKAEGLCTLRSGVCAPTKAACAASVRCKTEGRCDVESDMESFCSATKPEHCQASTNCADEGECTMKWGGCSK